MLILPCEDTVKKSPSTSKWALIRLRICWDFLDLGLPSLQNCEKYISVIYKLPSPWYVVITAQIDEDIFLLANFRAKVLVLIIKAI